MPRADTKKKQPARSKTSRSSSAKKGGAKKATRKAPARKAPARTSRKQTTSSRGRGVRGGQATLEISSSAKGPDREYLEKNKGGLSRTTVRARWIADPGEHAERDGQSLATRSHDVIMKWAEERGAVPATVPGTEHDNHLGVLRLNFPGYGGQSLQEVSWDDWFRTFDDRQLTFVFQEKKKDGAQSNFFKLDSPLREDG